jgi:hypothetical protein
MARWFLWDAAKRHHRQVGRRKAQTSSLGLGHHAVLVAQTPPESARSAGIIRRSPPVDLACQSHSCASFASSAPCLRSERSAVRIGPGAWLNPLELSRGDGAPLRVPKQRLRRDIGVVGPDDRARLGVDAQPREVGRVAQRLEHAAVVE